MISKVRTVISLDKDDKRWLERTSSATGLPETEIVRQAIRRMREQEDATFAELLSKTSGLWKKGDGLKYQRRIRREWR